MWAMNRLRNGSGEISKAKHRRDTITFMLILVGKQTKQFFRLTFKLAHRVIGFTLMHMFTLVIILRLRGPHSPLTLIHAPTSRGSFSPRYQALQRCVFIDFRLLFSPLAVSFLTSLLHKHIHIHTHTRMHTLTHTCTHILTYIHTLTPPTGSICERKCGICLSEKKLNFF